MRVLFKVDVEGVARAGQVKDVSDGYARNYLLRRGLAVPATPQTLSQAAAAEAAAARHAAEDRAAAEALKAKLEAAPVVVSAKAGSQGRLYGSVTAADVAGAVRAQLGASLDRHDLELAEPIRHVGSFQVRARLARGVMATLTVDVRAADAG